MVETQKHALQITLPDGSVKAYDHPVSGGDVAAGIGSGLAKAAIGAKVNGTLVDLNHRIESDASLAIVTQPRIDKKGLSKGQPDPDALYLLRHSCRPRHGRGDPAPLARGFISLRPAAGERLLLRHLPRDADQQRRFRPHRSGDEKISSRRIARSQGTS